MPNVRAGNVPKPSTFMAGWPGLSLRSPGFVERRGFEDSAPASLRARCVNAFWYVPLAERDFGLIELE
jgi:hypothetical protein